MGFTLIEIAFTLGFIVLLAGLSLWSLQPAKTKAPTRGLATALAEEFGAARQLAISTGKPVALGIPTDAGATPRACSIYRLEGWNRPIVTWAHGYRGDYPRTVFLAADWDGPTFTPGAPASTLSKFKLFQLDKWLPDEFKKDYIFCFTPDGGLVTNGLPTLQGRYSVVVAESPSVSGSAPADVKIDGTTDAITLFVSPSGGVEIVTGLPGGTVGPAPGASAQASDPQARTNYGAAGANVQISEILVSPNPADAPPGQGICVPGQFVTLEVYAYDPAGRTLFSKWTQVGLDTPGVLGQFTYPDSAGVNTDLGGEVDKMEFVYDYPPLSELSWIGTPPPPGVGVFRARWSWTVPITSQPGERFTVQADVKDVKGEVQIQNPPVISFTTPAEGQIIVEKLRDNPLAPGTKIWQLVQMNPDGSGETLLSDPGVEEIMPTIDRAASKLACLQGPALQRYVRVRNLRGGRETTIAGPGNFTSVSISPDGGWVSYRNNTTQELFTTRVDKTVTFKKNQIFSGGGHAIKKSRSGWSQNSRFLIYEDGLTIKSVDLHNVNLLDPDSTPDKLLISSITNPGPPSPPPSPPPVTESLYCPSSYAAPGGERILFSAGNLDPVLLSVAVTQANYEGVGPHIDGGNLYTDYFAAASGDKLKPDTDGGGGSADSNDLDDDYPAVSSDSAYLILTRSPETDGLAEDTEDQSLLLIPRWGDNFQGGGPGVKVIEGDVRRAIWIPAEE